MSQLSSPRKHDYKLSDASTSTDAKRIKPKQVIQENPPPVIKEEPPAKV
jgi:hypothetical protein